MVTKEEVFAAVRMITEYCLYSKGCPSCELHEFCYDKIMFDTPEPLVWPDPEGGGKDGNRIHQ